MLKKILSISGRPGLYKLVSYGKNMLLVESLVDGKRFPVHSRERVMSLGDISMYTTADDIPLSQVLENVGKKYENKPLDAKAYASPDQLHEFMAGVLARSAADAGGAEPAMQATAEIDDDPLGDEQHALTRRSFM